MNVEFTAQLFGLVSFGLGLSTFYQKDDRKLKVIMLLLNVNHLVHFLLLGSLLSAVGAALSALRTYCAIYTRSIWVAAIFIGVGVASGTALAENWYQLFPIAGTIIGTYSIFLLKGITLRIGFLLGSTCWLVNNLMVGSIGGSLLEISVIVMNITTIVRIYRDRQPLLQQ
ncbi:permease [Vibrio sp. qd031]|jgi:hypothetical protein|uniref:YgjV family protein n=1 Tax=Vibrio sp. qd031 TaxID=1603038 RepID=UPI000A1010F0|nr:YgjV family protein [Vibrio sp. qd031]ORT52264.1 permease [Vibrio sp. qd031]